MCFPATVIFMTNSMLLWWTLDSEPLPLVIKPKVVTETTMERRAQVQSYVSQTELASELNLHCYFFALVARHFRSKNN